MLFPIYVKIYPLMGGWRAECTKCGAYGTSEQYHATGWHWSEIGQAIRNLAANQNVFSDKSKDCPHFYGNYKPRVSFSMDFKDLPKIRETYSKQGCETFPYIRLDNAFEIKVDNAVGIDYNWSSYSYVRHVALEEQKEAEQKRISSELAQKVIIAPEEKTEAAIKIDSPAEPTPSSAAGLSLSRYFVYTLLILFGVWLCLLLGAATIGVPGARELLEKMSDGCAYQLCL